MTIKVKAIKIQKKFNITLGLKISVKTTNY